VTVGAENPGTGTDARVETVEKPQAADKPPPPPPDRPGAEGTPSRAESRAAASAPKETGTEERGGRDSKPALSSTTEANGEKAEPASKTKPESSDADQRDSSGQDREARGSNEQPKDGLTSNNPSSDTRLDWDQSTPQTERGEPRFEQPQTGHHEPLGKSGERTAETDGPGTEQRLGPVPDKAEGESGSANGPSIETGEQQPDRLEKLPGRDQGNLSSGEVEERPTSEASTERQADSSQTPQGHGAAPEQERPDGSAERPQPTDRPQAQTPSGQSEAPDQLSQAETKPADADSGREQPDADKTTSPLEQRPSAGGFENLAEEFDARRASREQTTGTNDQTSATEPEQNATRLDGDAIKEKIDPFAPDVAKAEGSKEPFERTIKDSDADWTEGVDRFEDLPTGEALAESDEDETKADKFRRQTYENYSGLDGRAKAIGKTIDQAFGARPTGHAETRADGPTMADPHHSSVDAGSTASALLTLGIVGAEATRRVVGKIREWRDT
jgi:hypothetical protein